MRSPTVQPSGIERTFGADEILVTKTDPQGRMTYVNDVFLRVSALTEATALGRPHNLIRHPDMPRIMFKLLWDELGAGREVFAYIVNLAVDGAHYWVLAHITPTFDDHGRIVAYHSSRRAPARPAVDAVIPLYRKLLDAERLHAHPSEAMAASGELMAELTAAFPDGYEEMVWSLGASR